MQFVAMILIMLVSSGDLGWTSVSQLPFCQAPSTRALVKASVEQTLTRLGVPAEPDLFTLLDELKGAAPMRAGIMEAEIRRASSKPLTAVRICEVDDPKMRGPMFVTVFVAGPGIPQPSGYVTNIGVPGAAALIGDPPR